MLLIPCPFCGPRAEIEFSNAGEGGLIRPRDPATLSDTEWAAFLYMRGNPKGPHQERWRHAQGCGRFFTISRDTITDQFVGPGA
jgi:sarcosine oxidase subunit delta